MSKPIKITEEIINNLINEFKENLEKTKFSDGKVTYSKTLSSKQNKATLRFTEIAWIKMQTLISEFDNEVAWHGIAVRGKDESENEYIIKDILVYPQKVTGATVNTEQEAYEKWLYSDELEDVFNDIRMQGHSHVNMDTTPSSVDLHHQEEILYKLDDDMFYIFLIWNKRDEKNIKIYDLKKNELFETSDITVKIDSEFGLGDFVEDAKSKVKVFSPYHNEINSLSYFNETDLYDNNKYYSGKNEKFTPCNKKGKRKNNDQRIF